MSTYTMKWSGNTGLRERLSIDADGAAVNPASRMGRGSAGGPAFGQVIEPAPPPATAATLPFEPGEAPLTEGARVGDFRIRGLLGEGAMGQVYLAQDLTLGRRVALKLFKRSVVQDDVAERFLEEARATASFNHPHIVTLHAVGEHLGRPYLALEYIDGESLRARLAAGPLPVREALRHGRAVADAIAEAHRHGLVHADLKPENVVISRDGRVRVVDFGLARLAGGTATSGSGTPAYMAPERWRHAPPTGAIDVWAFGMMLHELVTGRRPFSDEVLRGLAFSSEPVELPIERLDLPDEPWAGLVRDCLAIEPAARPTADELVRRLTALLDPRAAAADGDARCPFPGLAAFSRDDAAGYFGRRAELDALVEGLRTRALIPVVGPSGIGKSSFIRAALLPRLDETGRWVVRALRPGAAPFEALAAALVLPGQTPAALAEALRRHPDRLSLVLADVARHHEARVLVFLDQFEEAFTLAADPAEAIAFCDCLARAAAAAAAEPWRIVLTLRDDFLGRLAAAPAMRPHLGGVMLLPPLSPADLRAAIAGPLGGAGYEADTPGLIARIVDDVAGQPACLPLLQFTCRALWERRDPGARRILTAEYEAMGGATGALASHAQRLMAELAPDEVRLVRGLLLALVHPDGTRRPRLRAELLDGVPDGAREVAELLLDRLLERRLLVAARDTERDAAAIEVAHEALAAAWPQLARWLDETYEARVLVAELEQASRLWLRRGRRPDETWGGVALADAVRKVTEWTITLPSVSRAFLDASVSRDRRRQRRRRWIAGGVIGGLVAAAVVAVAFARTEQERRNAAENRGELDLALEPFDWDAAGLRRVPPAARPALAWKLHFAGAPDGAGPGAPGEALLEPGERLRRIPARAYRPDELRRGGGAWQPTSGGFTALVERVSARSSAAVLEVSRGACAPSRIFLRQLPGYREPGAPVARLHIPVPTCQASSAGTVEIPAGEFYASYDRPDATGQDVRRSLPAFRIDRTEVTRAAFAVYGALEPLTGDAAAGPRVPAAASKRSLPAAERDLPVVGINYTTALAYCEYLGKTLPSVEQWQKAFRGGIELPSGANPAPKRQRVWEHATSDRPANLAYPDGPGAAAPVGSYPDDTSPYGVQDLAGNVSEWSRSPAVRPEFAGLRVVLGANWDTAPELKHHLVSWQNARVDQYLDFVIGLRCVSQGPD
jgi:eukaryotic-like serine/threonine-protein kinase